MARQKNIWKKSEEIDSLQEQLARLSHYESLEEMLMDSRGCGKSDFPFRRGFGRALAFRLFILESFHRGRKNWSCKPGHGLIEFQKMNSQCYT